MSRDPIPLARGVSMVIHGVAMVMPKNELMLALTAILCVQYPLQKITLRFVAISTLAVLKLKAVASPWDSLMHARQKDEGRERSVLAKRFLRVFLFKT